MTDQTVYSQYDDLQAEDTQGEQRGALHTQSPMTTSTSTTTESPMSVAWQVNNETTILHIEAFFPFTATSSSASSSSTTTTTTTTTATHDNSTTTTATTNTVHSAVVIDDAVVLAKAAVMGQFHFNERNNAVAPQLSRLVGEDCPIRLTMDLHDTRSDPFHSTRKFVTEHTNHIHPTPGVVLGSLDGSVTEALATISSSLYQLPQVSYGSRAARLDHRGTFPLLGKLTASYVQEAKAMSEFVHGLCEITHVAVVYLRTDSGVRYAASLHSWCRDTYNVVVHKIGVKADGTDLAEALAELKNTQLRFCIGILEDTDFVVFLEKAVEAGVIGNDYFWILGGGFPNRGTVDSLRLPADSPVLRAANGIALITESIDYNTQSFSDFAMEWFRLDDPENNDFWNYLASKTSLPSDTLQERPFPTEMAARIYDSVLAIGIAACNTTNQSFTGTELFDFFLTVDFIGATNRVVIDSETGGRDRHHSAFRIMNVRVGKNDNDGLAGLDTVRTHSTRYNNVLETSEWTEVFGRDYVYADGTNDIPPALPEVIIHRHKKGVVMQSIVLTLAFIIMASAVYFIIWTWRRRKTRVVRSSQPTFLILVGIGVFFGVGSAVPLTFDEPPIDCFCMMGYYFFSTGFGLAFSAIFAKLWRVNEILNSKKASGRVVIKTWDILWPSFLLTSVNFSILLAWGFIAPLEFRWVFDEDGPRDDFGRLTRQTGVCVGKSDETSLNELHFLAIIIIIDGIALVYGSIQAYKARIVTTEYSESQYLGYTMASCLQALSIMCPVLFLAFEYTRARYAVMAGFALVPSATILYFIFVPKLSHYKQMRERRLSNRLRRIATFRPIPTVGGNDNDNDDAASILETNVHRSHSNQQRRGSDSIMSNGDVDHQPKNSTGGMGVDNVNDDGSDQYEEEEEDEEEQEPGIMVLSIHRPSQAQNHLVPSSSAASGPSSSASPVSL